MVIGLSLVTPAGVEPAIPGMKTQCPRPLDEGALMYILAFFRVNLYSSGVLGVWVCGCVF